MPFIVLLMWHIRPASASYPPVPQTAGDSKSTAQLSVLAAGTLERGKAAAGRSTALTQVLNHIDLLAGPRV